MAEEPGKAAKPLVFKYSRASSCVPIFADGVIGGISHKRMLRMGFFSERTQLPLSSTHRFVPATPEEVGPEALLKLEELGRESSQAAFFEREVQVEIVLTLDTAVSLHEWLTGHLVKLQENEQTQQSAKTDE